tara:strand:- start:614 stop:1051 length:438 start_codon:yes stop_codon:yes gene_type:complete
MIFDLINKKNNDTSYKNDDLVKMLSLLIHAAKIDEKYSEDEKKIILNFIKKSSKEMTDTEMLNLLKKAEEYENNSNQILEYTREVKKMDMNKKKLVLEFLWEIILSDNKSDIYENNLMRRLCGLLYVPDKLSGEIKSNIIKRKNL